MENAMSELIRYIVTALVDDVNAVEISEREDDSLVTVEIHVAPDDMGKIIGKQGRIAKAIRVVAKSAASKNNKKLRVDII